MPKRENDVPGSGGQLALVVHPDLTTATALHHGFQQRGFSTVVARDLPTALLMLTQHIFDVAVVCSRIGEPGDGWALAGIIRLVVPTAHVAVMARDQSVLTMQSAINSHSDQLLPATATPDEIVASVVSKIGGSTARTPRRHVN